MTAEDVHILIYIVFVYLVYTAADWWLSNVRPAPLWLFSEFGAIYLLT